ncbi:MAG: cytochrome C [Gammaproteobacteria bacterium]|nr:cytochrome C [Pseudomonadales bacterium]
MIERGQYLVKIAGCNDCHTAGYLVAEGDIPVSDWLKGDIMGWRGPWGTTYGANLRIYMQSLSEAQWVADARTLVRRPPMAWFNLNAMNEDDLKAIYHFVRSLGDPGEPAPSALAPGVEPPPPFATFP